MIDSTLPTTGQTVLSSASNATSADTPPLSNAKSPPRPHSRVTAFLVAILVVLLVLAGGLTAALWLQRQQFLSAGQNIAHRFDVLNSLLNQTQTNARQALTLAQFQGDKLATVENTLQETQSQYLSLQRAWQDFNNNVSDEVLTNDVEHLLTIADQQLRLAGNVSNAIVALETAQLQLARAHRPRFANLQQALNHDLEQLRAVPDIDISVQAARITRLMELVDKAPLWATGKAVLPETQTVPAQSTTVATPSSTHLSNNLPENAPWWQRWRAQMAAWPMRAGEALKRELAGLIQVQRVDQPEALLLSSDQTQQLRATLRQHLLTLQLALLMRQPTFWKNELDTVISALKTYFDQNAAETLTALNLANALAQTQIFIPLPSISASLGVVAALRTSEGRPSERQD